MKNGKRGCVCKRVPIKIESFPLYKRDVLVQLRVDNLEPYFDFGEEDYE